MSQIKQTLTDTIKVSMKAREIERVKVLRNVQAVIKQIEIDRRIELDDAEVLEILQKQLKQRHESLTIFTENGRDDLATKEQFEIDIINEYMPKQMDESEITALVNAEIAEQGATSMRDMGSVMGILKTKTAGRADPALISKLVKDALQGYSRRHVDKMSAIFYIAFYSSQLSNNRLRLKVFGGFYRFNFGINIGKQWTSAIGLIGVLQIFCQFFGLR